MKLYETQTRLLFCLALLVGFCAADAACFAQEKTEQGSSAVSETAEIANAKPVGDPDEYTKVLNDFTFDIMFLEPTSVEQFVALLREKTGGRINIIVANDARNMMLPSFELRGVSTASALNTMGEVTPEIYWDKVEEGIIVHSDAEILLKVFNVSRIVDRDDQAEAAMLSAIEIGLEMNNSSPENVNLKFHEETKLLFIKASDTDLDLVIQVLEQLGGKKFDEPNKVETDQRGGGGAF